MMSARAAPVAADELAYEVALIAAARRRQRRRWRRQSALIAGSALVIACTLIALWWPHGRVTPGGPGTHVVIWPTTPMPADVVVWNSSSIQVRSARTGRLIRRLAPAGLYCCNESISVSAGVVYFEADRRRRPWVESVPLRGGHVVTIAEGKWPAVSPDGRQLAYVTDPSRGQSGQRIVVRNLRTGTTRTWRFTSSAQGLDCCLSWSPGSAAVSFQQSASKLVPDSTHVLDIRSRGTLDDAPRLKLRPGLRWAAFLGSRTALAVESGHDGLHGQAGREELVAISVPGGQFIRRLGVLPSGGLAEDNSFTGAEGLIAVDGRYLLLSCTGPRGHGELYRLALGTGRPVSLGTGTFAAAWG